MQLHRFKLKVQEKKNLPGLEFYFALHLACASWLGIFFTKNLKIFNINLVTQEHVHQDGLSRGQVSVLMADAATA